MITCYTMLCDILLYDVIQYVIIYFIVLEGTNVLNSSAAHINVSVFTVT